MKLTNINYTKWQETKDTIQLFMQIVGKIKLAYDHRRNHWWHITYRVSPQGITTLPFYIETRLVEIRFNFVKHEMDLIIDDKNESLDLTSLSVKDFLSELKNLFKKNGIGIKIQNEVPFDTASTIPFAEDDTHKTYEENMISEWFENLKFANYVLKDIQNDFKQKISPVHLFWHSFDIATTLFTGNKAPEMPNADRVTKDAYSDEVVSFGWWPGDHKTNEAAFYAYTHPGHEKLLDLNLKDLGGLVIEQNGSQLAVLQNQSLLEMPADKQHDTILKFFRRFQKESFKLHSWSSENLYYEEGI